jgi:hypothetical protein
VIQNRLLPNKRSLQTAILASPGNTPPRPAWPGKYLTGIYAKKQFPHSHDLPVVRARPDCFPQNAEATPFSEGLNEGALVFPVSVQLPKPRDEVAWATRKRHKITGVILKNFPDLRRMIFLKGNQQWQVMPILRLIFENAG